MNRRSFARCWFLSRRRGPHQSGRHSVNQPAGRPASQAASGLLRRLLALACPLEPPLCSPSPQLLFLPDATQRPINNLYPLHSRNTHIVTCSLTTHDDADAAGVVRGGRREDMKEKRCTKRRHCAAAGHMLHTCLLRHHLGHHFETRKGEGGKRCPFLPHFEVGSVKRLHITFTLTSPTMKRSKGSRTRFSYLQSASCP